VLHDQHGQPEFVAQLLQHLAERWTPACSSRRPLVEQEISGSEVRARASSTSFNVPWDRSPATAFRSRRAEEIECRFGLLAHHSCWWWSPTQRVAQEVSRPVGLFAP